MSAGPSKLQAMRRLVALRKRMEEQAQANLRKVRLDLAETEALLQTPWATGETPRRAQDLEALQHMRDVSYVRLAEQESEATALQGVLQDKHRELRQVEMLEDHAKTERAQVLAKRESRDTDNWLRRQKDREDS